MDAEAERKNKEKLMEECYKKERGISEIRTKTKTLIPILESNEFVRKPNPFITQSSKLEARAFIMGRYGMLQCAANFSNGYGSKMCRNCGVEDNETHRINDCQEWKEINYVNSAEKIDYNLIYSEDRDEIKKVVQQILSLWDLGNGRNCMISKDQI